ncbi:hypothetical protein [Hydrogenophaga pseudoflava]|uniref:hypothetical protein n=1 Tax=Hydrogenophaga pseudoflava TaxID=47421 RepID=UPI0027E521A7|nr:hypothetical protein [Hydrogenophaga pseudoflava]MDQ7744663.1 hypothetical protein [Hydrogenophaga pseudoflava]
MTIRKTGLPWQWLPVLAVLAWALFLRLDYFAPGRSLWLDEAMLGVNLQHQSLSGLVKPLLYDQAAPLGFLLLQWLLAHLLAGSDDLLRVLPLLAGLALLPMVFALARQDGGSPFAWLALALVALAPEQVRYSSELKQYSLDALVAAYLMWCFGEALKQPTDPRARRRLALSGALAVWFSHPSVFVLAGLGGSVLLLHWRDVRDPAFLRFWAGVAAAWILSFAVLYLLHLRHVAANPSLTDFWRRSFAPLPPWSHWGWYRASLSGVLNHLFSFHAGVLPSVLVLLGTASLWWRRRPLALAMVLTLVATLVASSLSRYPFHGRFLLFMAPAAALALAEGVERCRQWLRAWHAGLAGVVYLGLAGLLLFHAVDIDRQHLQDHPVMEEIKPLMKEVAERRRPGDQIYVYYGAVPAFSFYAARYGFGPDEFVEGRFHRWEPALYLSEIDGALGAGRTWLVFSHNCNHCRPRVRINEQRFILDHADRRGTLLEQLDGAGTTAYLYDLGPPRPDAGPAAGR